MAVHATPRKVPRISSAGDSSAERIARARPTTHQDEQEPKGWREVCAQLQMERNRDKFRELVDQINRFLSAHEKTNRQQGSA